MFKKLFPGNNQNNYEDFYKKDTFIEGGELEKINLLSDLKGDFLRILIEYKNLAEHEKENFDLLLSNLKGKIDNKLHWSIFNKKGVPIFIDNGELFIDISNIIKSFILEKSKNEVNDRYSESIYKNKSPDESYKSAHSLGYQLFQEKVSSIFSKEELELLEDIYDNHTLLTISNINDIDFAIDLYERLNLVYLYERFNLNYNQFDERYYKILSETTGENFESFAKKIEEVGIIKGYKKISDIEYIDSYPVEKNIVGIIELETVAIGVFEINKKYGEDEHKLLMLGIDKYNKEVSDFLEKVYFFQKDFLINNNINKVIYLINEKKSLDKYYSTLSEIVDNKKGKPEENIIKQNEIKTFKEIELYNFSTDIKNTVNFYNQKLKGIIETVKFNNNLFIESKIKKQIEETKDYFKSFKGYYIDYNIKNYIQTGEYNKEINDFIIKNDLERLEKGKWIYWDKYLDKSDTRLISILYTNEKYNSQIEELMIYYIDYFIENNDIDIYNLENLKNKYEDLLNTILGNFRTHAKIDKEKGIEISIGEFFYEKFKPSFIEKIDFKLDTDKWSESTLDEMEEFVIFCRIFHLNLSDYLSDKILIDIYTNTLKERKIEEKELYLIENNKEVILTLYLDFIFGNNVDYIKNFEEFFIYENTRSKIIEFCRKDIDNFISNNDKANFAKLIELSEKYDLGLEAYLYLAYFVKNIGEINESDIKDLEFLKKNFSDLYNELNSKNKSLEKVNFSKKQEKLLSKLSLVSSKDYQPYVLLLDDEKVDFTLNFFKKIKFKKINKLTKENRLGYEESLETNKKIPELIGESFDILLISFFEVLNYSYDNNLSDIENNFLGKFQDLLDGEVYDKIKKDVFNISDKDK